MLFFDVDGAAGTSDYSTGKDILTQLSNLKEAVSNFVAPNLKEAFKNLSKEIISIENTSKTLQKNMGGVAFNTQNFTQQLYEAYKVNMGIGATFKDSADYLQGMSGEMGRMVGISTTNLSNMVEFSKLTGIASESVGKMVAEMIRYGGTQEEAYKELNKMRKEAVVLGLNANKFITDVNANMKKLSGFGFKDGIEGLKKMVKQSQLLRSSISDIGAAQLQSKILDPEGAIQAAASFQMLGGAVGKLADPFQLLHMAQTDMQGLQDEIVKSTKSSFAFNKATGQFEASTQDLYRLREQANIVGADFEKMAEAGREAAKLEFIENAIDLSNVSEESKGLLAGLTTIQKGTGKIQVDVPGFDSQGKTLEEILGDTQRKADLDKALADYQSKMALSEKELAVDQLSISQKQAIDVREIKETIMAGLTSEERIELENKVAKASENVGGTTTKLAEKGVSEAKGKIIDIIDYYGNKSNYEEKKTAVDLEKERTEREAKEKQSKEKVKVNDMLYNPTDAPQLLAKGKIYEGIAGDQVAIGTNIVDALNSNAQSNTIGGKIDININLNGAINGDSGMISKMFNSPQVQKQIMDTVLYKLKDYKNQQGVIS